MVKFYLLERTIMFGIFIGGNFGDGDNPLWGGGTLIVFIVFKMLSAVNIFNFCCSFIYII